jgi:hypothetical protein
VRPEGALPRRGDLGEGAAAAGEREGAAAAEGSPRLALPLLLSIPPAVPRAVRAVRGDACPGAAADRLLGSGSIVSPLGAQAYAGRGVSSSPSPAAAAPRLRLAKAARATARGGRGEGLG